ncbi:MAG: RDD family protein [Solirubrobacteraceae bacterium]
MTTARLAGFVSRTCALAIDGAILAGIAFLVGAGVALAAHVVGIDIKSGDAVVAVLAAAGWVVMVDLYFGLFWSLAGQTPGMRFMGLRVIDRRGSRITYWQAVRRLVGMYLAALPAGAGFLLILVDDRRRGLQDFVAGTLVIHDPAAQGAAPSEAAPAAADDRERVELVHGDGRTALGGHA